MNKAVILTQAMIIDGHVVRMTFAPEDNSEALQDVKDILLGTLENPHNLQLFSEGGVADERAAQIMTNRTQHKSGTPLSTKGEALLTGLLYCADCRRKIIRTASGGKGRKPRERYQCYHRVRHPDECHNQSAFNMERLDSIVEQAVLILFDNMGTVSADYIIENRYNKETRLAEARVRKLTVECDEAQKNVDIYKSEVGRCLRGISKWDSALLRELLEEAQTILQKTEAELQQAQTELDNCAALMEQIKTQHDELICWSKVFAKSSTAAKKMILSKLIERIEVGRGYEINISFRISYAQFCGVPAETETDADCTD